MNNQSEIEINVQNMSFEEAMQELEDTVGKLEQGNLNLEESLALFEKGQALAAFCNAQLEAASLKVEQLTRNGEVLDISD